MMLWSLKTHETSKFYIVRESMHTLLMLRQDISKFGNVFLTPHPASKQQIFLNGIKVFIIQGNISLSHPLLSDFTKVSASRLCHWPNVGTVGVDFCLWGQQPWLWAGAPTNPVLCWVTTCKRSWKAVEDSGPGLSSLHIVPKLLHPWMLWAGFVRIAHLSVTLWCPCTLSTDNSPWVSMFP